ncbi:MAG: FAD-dependent oxidoreductase [bacterium]
MSDRFSPLPAGPLAAWIFCELDHHGAVFGIPSELFHVPGANPYSLQRSGRRLETPIGVAAGPHTQLAQNLVAAWLTGARFLELKTVQTLDELNVAKPCIDSEDTTFNCEWSQELRLQESFDEYLKAWVLLHALRHRLGWIDDPEEPGFVFNISVGYNLEGIRQPNVGQFLDRMTDCSAELPAVVDAVAEHYPEVRELSIPIRLSDNVTLSTMHGCPPDEIERIARYLIEERGLHTAVKLNPTLLGPERLRAILNDRLGYTQLEVPDEAFGHDLKYPDAVRMIAALREAAANKGVDFGLKLTNTLEVVNHRTVFPGSETMMYMSGRALHPLTINLADQLQRELGGAVPISVSGGADAFNLGQILDCGLVPVTVCSDLLKPGGYLRLPQYLRRLEAEMDDLGAADLEEWIVWTTLSYEDRIEPFMATLRDQAAAVGKPLQDEQAAQLLARVDELGQTDASFVDAWQSLAAELTLPAGLEPAVVRACRLVNQAFYAEKVLSDPRYGVTERPVQPKGKRPLDWFDCIHAPCQEACPASQDVPNYLHLVAQERDFEALRVIRATNDLPHITGAVCDHPCTARCVRNHYDEPLAIRQIKRFAAVHGGEDEKPRPRGAGGEQVAVVGAGPAGLTAAHRLSREGYAVTIFEARDEPGGMVSGVIPSFRLSAEEISWDVDRLLSAGAELRCGQRIGRDVSFEDLRRDHALVILAVGAQEGRRMGIEGEDSPGVMDGLSFLGEVRAERSVELGDEIVVVGGGNAAMDAARTAWRVAPQARVTVLYRRTRAEMPADAEEIEALVAEGIRVQELVTPIRVLPGTGRIRGLECLRMELSEADDSGRPRPVPVEGSEHELRCTALIVCVSQRGALDFLSGTGVELSRWGTIVADPDTAETTLAGVYAVGDAVRGPATVIKAVADGRRVADAIVHARGRVDRGGNGVAKSANRVALLRRRSERRYRDVLPERAVAERRNFEEVTPLLSDAAARREAKRCLLCNEMCSLCVTVCPNRANQAYEMMSFETRLASLRVVGGEVRITGMGSFRVDQRWQIVHVADFCNECGNCQTFCPSAGAPYRDKPRLYLDRASYEREQEGALFAERVDKGMRLSAMFAGQQQQITIAGGEIRYESPKLRARIERSRRRLTEVIPGPQAVDGEQLQLETAARMYVVLDGIMRSLGHLVPK